MCDQTEIKYKPGDVVWVKLANIWWPAEVQDQSKLDEDVTGGLRKEPLAVVKFFEEDSYEFPKNLDQIYHYNCLKKDEFIKKGLDLHRAAANKTSSRSFPSCIEKFPRDVTTAEEKVKGDPKYIYNAKFAPAPVQTNDKEESPAKKIKLDTSVSKKLAKHQFGSPPPRVSFHKPITVKNTPDSRNKSKKSLSILDESPQSILKKKRLDHGSFDLSNPKYYCVLCKQFKSRHNAVILAHLALHYSGVLQGRPNSIPSRYMNKFNSTLNGASDDLTKSQEKRKRKKPAEEPPPKNSEVVANVEASPSPTQKKRSKKIKTVQQPEEVKLEALEILKDWSDSEEESDMTSKHSEVKPDESINSTKPDEVTASPAKSMTSCFDFEDNDDSLNVDGALKFGQKLPRVLNEKQSSNRMRTNSKTDDVTDDLSKQVDSFLETTNIPNLPQIPQNTSSLTDDAAGHKKISEKKNFIAASTLSEVEAENNTEKKKPQNDVIHSPSTSTSEESESVKKKKFDVVSLNNSRSEITNEPVQEHPSLPISESSCAMNSLHPGKPSVENKSRRNSLRSAPKTNDVLDISTAENEIDKKVSLIQGKDESFNKASEKTVSALETREVDSFLTPQKISKERDTVQQKNKGITLGNSSSQKSDENTIVDTEINNSTGHFLCVNDVKTKPPEKPQHHMNKDKAKIPEKKSYKPGRRSFVEIKEREKHDRKVKEKHTQESDKKEKNKPNDKNGTPKDKAEKLGKHERERSSRRHEDKNSKQNSERSSKKESRHEKDTSVKNETPKSTQKTSKNDSVKEVKNEIERSSRSESRSRKEKDKPTKTESNKSRRNEKKVRSESDRPTRNESDRPTRSESDRATRSDSDRPTRSESDRPTRSESDRPTRSESDRPTRSESDRPTRSESDRPTRSESDRPTRSDSDRPTRSESDRPTRSDSEKHTKNVDRSKRQSTERSGKRDSEKHDLEKTPNAKHELEKTPNAKHELEKTPIAKHELEKTPISKHDLEKTPIAKHDLEKTPNAKHDLEKTPNTKHDLEKTPKTPNAKHDLEKTANAKHDLEKTPNAKHDLEKTPNAKHDLEKTTKRSDEKTSQHEADKTKRHETTRSTRHRSETEKRHEKQSKHETRRSVKHEKYTIQKEHKISKQEDESRKRKSEKKDILKHSDKKEKISPDKSPKKIKHENETLNEKQSKTKNIPPTKEIKKSVDENVSKILINNKNTPSVNKNLTLFLDQDKSSEEGSSIMFDENALIALEQEVQCSSEQTVNDKVQRRNENSCINKIKTNFKEGPRTVCSKVTSADLLISLSEQTVSSSSSETLKVKDNTSSLQEAFLKPIETSMEQIPKLSESLELHTITSQKFPQACSITPQKSPLLQIPVGGNSSLSNSKISLSEASSSPTTPTKSTYHLEAPCELYPNLSEDHPNPDIPSKQYLSPEAFLEEMQSQSESSEPPILVTPTKQHSYPEVSQKNTQIRAGDSEDTLSLTSPLKKSLETSTEQTSSLFECLNFLPRELETLDKHTKLTSSEDNTSPEQISSLSKSMEQLSCLSTPLKVKSSLEPSMEQLSSSLLGDSSTNFPTDKDSLELSSSFCTPLKKTASADVSADSTSNLVAAPEYVVELKTSLSPPEMSSCTSSQSDKPLDITENVTNNIKVSNIDVPADQSNGIFSAQDMDLDIKNMPIEIESDIEPKMLPRMEICFSREPFKTIPGLKVFHIILRISGEPFPKQIESVEKNLLKFDKKSEDDYDDTGFKRRIFPTYKPEHDLMFKKVIDLHESSFKKPEPISVSSLKKPEAVSTINVVPVPNPSKGPSGSLAVPYPKAIGDKSKSVTSVNPASLASSSFSTLPFFSFSNKSGGSVFLDSSKVNSSIINSLCHQKNSHLLKNFKVIPSKPVLLTKTGSINPNSGGKPKGGSVIFSGKSKQVRIPVLSQTQQSSQTVALSSKLVRQISFPENSQTLVTSNSRNIVFNGNTLQLAKQVGLTSKNNSASKIKESQIEKEKMPVTKAQTKPHKSPNILQKSPKRPVKQKVVTTSNSQTVKSSPALSSQSVIPNLKSSADSVIYVTVDKDGNYVPSKKSVVSVPIQSTTKKGNQPHVIRPSSTKKPPAQDILAEALANTQVLQSELEGVEFADAEFSQTSLSNTVLETSLTLNQPPIMSPLELPSSMSSISNETQTIFISDSLQIIDSPIVLAPEGSSSGEPKFIITGIEAPVDSRQDKDNVLPEFLKGDFTKKTNKSRKSFGDR